MSFKLQIRAEKLPPASCIRSVDAFQSTRDSFFHLFSKWPVDGVLWLFIRIFTFYCYNKLAIKYYNATMPSDDMYLTQS